ncbi:MAG: associated Golgi protein [Lacunisphaera sp.]|nr:associated Golgi protein [Lacunisphaera sp.]
MSEPAPRPRPNRALLLKLAAVAVVLLVAGGLVLRGLDWKTLLDQGLDLLRGAGPVAFFVGMTLLPAVGVPVSAFLLTAGPVFGPQFGLGWVIVLCLLAVTANMILTFFLASRAFRPLVEKLLTKLGYKLPQAGANDATDLIILLRVIGLPFPAQNYLLGLAGLPLGKYVLVSCLVSFPMNVAMIFFGDALLHGKGKLALLGFCLLLALMAATQLLRKHYGKKRA